MALSQQDQDFYEEKLSLKTFCILIGATMLIGGVMWPILIYLQDMSNGLASQWNFKIGFDWSMIGVMVGTIVAVLMYLAFKFLLSMGWLPARRQ